MRSGFFLFLAAVCPTLAQGQSFTQAPGSPFTTGFMPRALVAGDFNNDGKLDMATANLGSNNVTVMLGDGAGGFAISPAGPFATGTRPVAIVTGDCNADGNLDLVVANYGSNNITVLLGNGSGGFTQAPGSPYTVGNGPGSLVLADINRDHVLDFAVTNGSSSTVSVFLGNGAGGFGQAASSPFATGGGPVSIVAGDFNLDGNPDLVTLNSENSYSVLLGNGSGNFTASTTSLNNSGFRHIVYSLVTSDFNSDGKPDIALTFFDASNGSNSVDRVYVFLGDGLGGFTGAPGSPLFSPGNEPFSIAAADLNGDGKVDLVISNYLSFNITVFPGDGTGGFAPPVQFGAGVDPYSVVIGDWNRDGRPDLAMPNDVPSTVTLLLNTTILSSQSRIGFAFNGYFVLDGNADGAFTGTPPDKYFQYVAPQPGDIAVTGDWNGDGRTKVGIYRNGFWLLDYNGNGIYDYDGTPSGDRFLSFGGASAQGYVPMVGDWNGDGKTKIGYYYQGFWALDYNGDGTFNSGDRFFGFGGRPNEYPLLGDWNGDGRTKVGVFSNGTFLLDYDGSGGFNSADKSYAYVAYTAADKPVVGDWNGTGFPKIGIYRDGFWILDYNGNGVYDGADKFYGFGGSPGDIPVVGDWNGNGVTKIGVNRSGFWILDYSGNGSYDGTGASQDRVYGFGGNPGEQPIVGKWQ